MTPPQRIVITGGTGFVGRASCARLFAHDAGSRLVVPTRRTAQGRPIQMLPTVDLLKRRRPGPGRRRFFAGGVFLKRQAATGWCVRPG
jgi:nucleoside-diphosphate-sugar epimerase